MPRTFKLVLEYDGAAFEGWQKQPGGHRTVQGELIAALERLGTGALRVMGAGRTDAGVHAEGQVASVSMETALDAGTLLRALNGGLPRDLAVVSCEDAPPGFDARRDATGKHYRYRIWNGAVRSPLRRSRSHAVPRPLDLGAMAQAAAALVGTHDFACFQAAGSEVPHTVRTLRRCDVSGHSGAGVVLDLVGDGFLRHMVRNVAGTLIQVGLGQRGADTMPTLLAGRDRGAAGPTAPAHGLTLVSVAHPEGSSAQGPT